MFIDKVSLQVAAGNGGDGLVAFRQEKFVDKGGPNGGDGGDGGSVVLVATNNENTLARFRYEKLIAAEHGEAGKQSNQHGRKAQDLLVYVPVGTVASQDGRVLADLVTVGQRAVIARGGQGGFGNAHFKSSVRQAPLIAEKGEPGEQRDIMLELKMIADVGLVGLPNAGKSTLLASISNARPEIANYPFTTLRPNLGVVDVDEHVSLLFADIPGLIEGASEGKGLGDEFLRHIERTKVLVHMIDCWQDDIAGAYKTIMGELGRYTIDLSTKPQLVVLSKIDGMDDELLASRIEELRAVVPADNDILTLSAQSKKNLKPFLYAVAKMAHAEEQRRELAQENMPIITLEEVPEQSWHVYKHENAFVVEGRKIERFAVKTDLNDWQGERRVRDIMKKMGIMRELDKQGAAAGMIIYIGASRAMKIIL